MAKPMHVLAKAYTDLYGFHLVPIDPGRKFPSANDWGNQAISDPDKAESFYKDNPDWNMGVALGPSGLCSLDIDCDESFAMIMEEFGIDPCELLDYPTIQGRDKGRRLMFRVPDNASLPYTKMNWPSSKDPSGDLHKQMMKDAARAKEEGDTEKESRIREDAKQFARYTVFELRSSCDGKQRQDVVPPSIHPDTGKPYKWLVKPPAKGQQWPEPPRWLLAMWSAWDDFKPQLQSVCPWSEKPEHPKPKQQPKRPDSDQGGNVIQAFIDAHDLRMILEQYGYSRKGKSRYLSPHTSTNLPGVVLFPDEQSCWIHHASDPLCSEEHGRPVNAFDLFCEYEHGGDIGKAVKGAGEMLGIKPERKRTEAAKEINPDPQPAKSEDQGPPSSTDAPSQVGPTHAPFRCLGYNDRSYYYLPAGTEQVAEIKRGSHSSPAELLGLARLEFWESAYPKGDNGVNWNMAANDCMRGCEIRGIYSQETERGRGAWYDKGRAVLHLGDRLLVDGKTSDFTQHKSKYIYTRHAPLEHGADAEPADDQTAMDVAELFEELHWAKPVYAQMLAGWCLLAPICGALSWRPHVWITSQRGAGKSWIQSRIIQPLLGPAALMAQGSTTEAGLRQVLKKDARPVVFDEAESEDLKSQKRMQAVVELARQSSSDGGAEIIKGTSDGGGMAFRMRCMFLMGSVNVSLSQAADESRFSVLAIATHEKTQEEIERFDAFSKRVDNMLTDELCASIRARAYRLMPVIRANAKTFSRACAEVLKSQRLGDQVGTLIAGACAYYRSDEITLDDARKWVEGMDFSDAREQEQVSDEESCLQRILQSQIQFDSDKGLLKRSIGELVDCAAGHEMMDGLTQATANDILSRYGLKQDGNYLTVANKHAELEKLLKDTPWGSGWRRILGRIPDAHASFDVVRFAGTRSRAIRVPLSFMG